MHRRRGERQKPPLRCRRRFARIRKHCYRRREKCLLWFSLFLTFAQAPPCPSDGDAIDTETVIFLFFLSSLPPPPPPPPTPPEIALCYSWQQPVEEEDIFPPRFLQFHLISPPPCLSALDPCLLPPAAAAAERCLLGNRRKSRCSPPPRGSRSTCCSKGVSVQ